MDSLDVRILRVMGFRPFARWPRQHQGVKPAVIARALGRSVQVVKDRISKLEAEGVIRGYGVAPNLAQLGTRTVSVHMTMEDAPDPAQLGRLETVEGVSAVLRFYGPQVCFDLNYGRDGERQERLNAIRGLLPADADVLWSHELPFPDVEGPLARLDCRILLALRGNARRPLAEVAREVGVTAKTVRTRLARLEAQGSFVEYVKIDFAAMRGKVPFILYVQLEPGGPDPTVRLLERFDERRLSHFLAAGVDPGTLVMHLVADSPAQVQDMAREAAAVPGVARATPQMPTGGFLSDAWVDARLAKEAEREPHPAPTRPRVSRRAAAPAPGRDFV